MIADSIRNSKYGLYRDQRLSFELCSKQHKRDTMGDHRVYGRQREVRKTNSRAQVWARYAEASPLPTPPGPLKLRLFGE